MHDAQRLALSPLDAVHLTGNTKFALSLNQNHAKLILSDHKNAIKRAIQVHILLLSWVDLAFNVHQLVS